MLNFKKMILKTLSIWASLGLILLADEVNTMNDVSSQGSTLNGEISVQSLMDEREDDAVISEFDSVFREIAGEQGNDWRLMSAIAYHESRFKPDVSSSVGATGLMQVMPRTAQQFGISREELLDVETNITVGNMVFKKIEKMLKLPASTSNEDRLSLYLAAYNGGVGHVFDAQRLARAHGENPNSWSVVSRYLKLKGQPQYYNHEVVRCGKFSGSVETLSYVEKVMNHYNLYCSIAPIN